MHVKMDLETTILPKIVMHVEEEIKLLMDQVAILLEMHGTQMIQEDQILIILQTFREAQEKSQVIINTMEHSFLLTTSHMQME